MTEFVARWITVGEAEAARMALNAAGIDAWLVDDVSITIYWLRSNALGGVKVMVRPDDAEEAREVLTTPAVEIAGPDPPDEPELEPLDETGCPACESDDVARIRKLPAFLALTVILIGVSVALEQPVVGVFAVVLMTFVFVFTPSHRCASCGERWSPDVEPLPPLPTPSDLEATRCPHCGSDQLYRIWYREMRAFSMMFNVVSAPMALLWILMPKRKCENCKHTQWW